jgi:hypothetical protein
MSEESSTAVERTMPMPAAPMPDDDEIRIMYRIAESLAMSGTFKGITKPAQAFAKMIIGRDFGMSPAQAMQGLHLVEGQIMVHYAMLGQFIRSRREEGYDYRPGWIKLNPALPGADTTERVTVWMDEDDPTDTREVVGAVVAFQAAGKPAGTSVYTMDHAVAAGLVRPKSPWETAPRNMLLARAMSNGVKWYVPEVLGGLPIYVEGEIVAAPDLTEGTGTGESQGLELGPKVDEVIARAEQLGHAGYADRATVEVALGNRAPGVVNDWVRQAHHDLNVFEEQQQVEPVDAEVVIEGQLSMEDQMLMVQLVQGRKMRDEEQDPEVRAQMDEELADLAGTLREHGVEVPE